MKFTLPAFATLAATASAQSSAPIITEGNIPAPPPWATNSAEWTSVYHSLVSEGKIPSTATGPPWSWPTSGWGPGQGPWGPGFGPGGPGGYRGPGGKPWGGPDGPGPFGPGSWGPWSDWSTRSDWRNGPWTRWWGGSACPGSDWPGWTEGPWSTNAPWTSWAGCTASTTGSSVVTTTVSGTPTTSTQYGVQVAQVAGQTDNSAQSTGLAVPMRTAVPGLAVGAAVLGLAVGL